MSEEAVTQLVQEYRARKKALQIRYDEETSEHRDVYCRARQELEEASRTGAMSARQAQEGCEVAWGVLDEACLPADDRYGAAIDALDEEFHQERIRRGVTALQFAQGFAVGW